jgi:predicted transcriptional regulator
MSLTVTLPSDLEAQVQQAAAKNGRDVEQYVLDAIKRAVLKPSLDEILAPVREQFAASGMTEEEFDQLIEEERQAIWEEKHGKKD